MRWRFLAVLVLIGGCAIVPQPAEIILTGGQVWTGVRGGLAEAIAVRQGKIVYVGSTKAVLGFKGPQTREIKLNGRLVVPGFMDSHTHFINGGFALGSVNLRPAKTPQEFTRILRDYVKTYPKGRWITEGDWDHEAWPGAPLPRHEWIDAVTPDNPVAVNRLDGHMIVVNAKALEIAGITRDTKDPPGGTIVRDARTGEPTGVLKDAAMDLIWRRIPEATAQERSEALHRAQAHALSNGVTLVEDMGNWDNLIAYRIAQAAGDLKMRVYALVPLDSWKRLSDYVARNGNGNLRLRWGGLKGFVDGSLGSTTAWFYEPYVDAPSTNGLMVTDTAKLREWALAADRAGLQVVMHAIGDHANDWLLDTYEWINAQNGERDRRFRIEHAQHLSAAAIPRFAQLGVIPSMQPYHAIDDGRWAEKRIGPERIKTTYAFRSLLDAGARLNFGSDWTVAPMSPLLGIYAAVTRRTLDDKNPDGWVPEQRITVEEALRAYTMDNAFSVHFEHELGTLERTKRGDMVVLSENILKIDPVRIKDARVDYTIINGEVVFERK
ncbi:MAG TPA: amidohydrolase [Longimicrobiales bacterium]|nr:amidohydrolase [Longimicrobiales bacterium]